MRIGTRVGRRSWISMGPLGWLLAGWIVGPFLLLWWFAAAMWVVTVFLCRLAVRVVGNLQSQARRS